MSNLTQEEKIALIKEAHRLLDRINELMDIAFDNHEEKAQGSPDACRPEFDHN